MLRRWFAPVLLLGVLMLAPVFAHAQVRDTVTVTWTAPGDDVNAGTASEYELRFSESPITASNFGQATPVSGVPAPRSAGTRQSVVVRGLTPGTTYWFAIRSADDAGNWSAISNVARWDWVLDTAPPGMPTGLGAQLEVQSVRIHWNNSPEPDLAGYRIYRGTAAAGPFSLISGTVTANEFIDANLPSGSGQLWYQIAALDLSGNESARTAPVMAGAGEGVEAPVTVESGYPNPSRLAESVRIPVQVASGSADITIDIVDSGGRRVRRIDAGAVSGTQEIVWDGKNDDGRSCAPGPYRAWLITGKSRQSVRIVRVP